MKVLKKPYFSILVPKGLSFFSIDLMTMVGITCLDPSTEPNEKLVGLLLRTRNMADIILDWRENWANRNTIPFDIS